MSIGLLGKKVGMTRVFTDNGESIPVTVLKIETNIVSMIKSIDSDGYNALQLSTVELKENKTKKPHLGHFKKNNITPQKNIKEFRVENISEISIGQEFEAEYFEEGTFVNVRSRSKGKGFAGTIKRHNFKGKDATHGNSISHRTPGSTGQCQFPGRVFKGKKMAGHMGDEMVTKKNLQIVKVDIDKKLILVKGAVPGFNGRLVEVTQSSKIKKVEQKAKVTNKEKPPQEKDPKEKLADTAKDVSTQEKAPKEKLEKKDKEAPAKDKDSKEKGNK